MPKNIVWQGFRIALFIIIIVAVNPATCAERLTGNETKVMPYLLKDVKNYDRWPGTTGWELFGLSEAQLKAKYGSLYAKTKKGGRLDFDYGAQTVVFNVTYVNNKVNAVTRNTAGSMAPPEPSITITDRSKALQKELTEANEEVDRDRKNTDNVGFLWYAYRNRARIERALGNEAQALQDIKAAETVELQILKDPKKSLEDHRPVM